MAAFAHTSAVACAVPCELRSARRVRVRASAFSVATVTRRLVCGEGVQQPLASAKRSLAASCRPLRLREHLGTRLAVGVRARVATQQRGRAGLAVQASFFGVGAPEAFVIAIVSLLVFGPKGLAEIAKNLGQTLRAFQPTIRELQQVSQDFKTALDQEIGLDELKSSASTTTMPRPDLDSKLTEEMRRASEAAAWGGAPPGAPANLPEGTVTAQPPPAATAAPPQPGKLPDLSQFSE